MKAIISTLKKQRSQLMNEVSQIDVAIAALEGHGSRTAAPKSKAKRTGRKRKMSTAGRKAVSRRMKKYWADRRKKAKDKK